MSDYTKSNTQGQLDQAVANAVNALRAGGVIAYPTEFCFGLGCDPRNEKALERLLAIKQRQREQGVILIAANISQVEEWVDFKSSPLQSEIQASWPGPNTWLLPALDCVSPWVRGHHTTVAMRITAHSVSKRLCHEFGGAIVSTSANRHGQDALRSASAVNHEMGVELDFILDAPLGGADSASTIRDGQTGQLLR